MNNLKINNIKEWFEKHYKILFTVVALIFSLLLLFMAVKDNFIGKTYKAGDFLSGVVKGKQKLIEDDASCVFTYGPYISLEQGKYKLTLYYSGDSENDFDVTGNLGGKKLAYGSLPSDKNKLQTDFEVDDSISNKSIEIRTIYRGKGSFEFYGANIRPVNVNIKSFVPFILFALCCIFLYMIYSKDIYRLTAYQLFCIFIAVMTYKTISVSFIAVLGYSVGIILMAICLKGFPEILKRIKTDEFVCIVIASYMLAVFLTCLHNDYKISTQEYLINLTLSQTLFITASVLSVALIARKAFLSSSFGYRMIALSSVLLGFMFLAKGERNIYIASGIILIVSYVFYYVSINDKIGLEKLKFSHKLSFATLCTALVVYICVFSAFTTARYKNFTSSTFDFGIFAQMYEYMAKTGMPLTTCERGELLSHFYIHFSPIYYIGLPFYMLIRKPYALLIMQTVVVALGALPVFFICRNRKATPIISLAIALAYLAMPSFLSPLYWDFHENKFLPLMLLSFIYFFDAKKYKPMYVFMVLTLMIKEDSALYIIFTALFFIVVKKEYKHGAIVMLSAVIYFMVVMAFIQHFGYGLMEGHYQDYYYKGEAGVADLASNIFINPGKFISNLFTEDTFVFIIYTMGALLFIPFASKDTRRLILMIPYIAINLMTSYSYQHTVGYQYTYGSVSLLLFLYIINTLDMDKNMTNMLAFSALFASCILIYTARGNLGYYFNAYNQNQGLFDESDNALERIPQDVSVQASTTLIPHLYDKREIYSYDSGEYFADYVALRKADSRYSQNYTNARKRDYKLVYENDFLIILRTQDAPRYNDN